MNDRFIENNISKTIDLAIYAAANIGKAVVFRRLDDNTDSKMVIRQVTKDGNYSIFVYGNLVDNSGGLGIRAVEYIVDKTKLLDFIIRNELVLSIE